MAKLPLLLYPNRELTLGSDPVEIEWVKSEEFQEMLNDMVETMTWYLGVGFSAIQAGIQDRAFVMKTKQGVLKIVNPVIESVDGELTEMEEGCLSIPGFTERVKRYPSVVLSFLNPQSLERERHDFEGVEAQCVQHEMEHLDGKMFSDGYGVAKRALVKKKIQKALRFDPRFKEL